MDPAEPPPPSAPPPLDTISARVKHARELRGMGTKPLSVAAGLSPAAVHHLEGHPDQDAKVGTLAALAKVLDADPCWLAFGRGRAPRAK